MLRTIKFIIEDKGDFDTFKLTPDQSILRYMLTSYDINKQVTYGYFHDIGKLYPKTYPTTIIFDPEIKT